MSVNLPVLERGTLARRRPPEETNSCHALKQQKATQREDSSNEPSILPQLSPGRGVVISIIRVDRLGTPQADLPIGSTDSIKFEPNRGASKLLSYFVLMVR